MQTKLNNSFRNLLNDAQIQSIEHHSSNLNIDPNWLTAVMYFETAGTLSPSKTNHIGSVGLIQFTRDSGGENGSNKEYKTISGKKYFLSDLKKMSFTEQMQIVELYLTPYKGKMNSYLDVYLAVFFPLAMDKNHDYVLKSSNLSASIIAKQNPIFDSNNDKKITRKEVTDYFKKYFDKKFGDGFFNSNVNNSKKKGLIIFLLVLTVILLTILTKNKKWFKK